LAGEAGVALSVKLTATTFRAEFTAVDLATLDAGGVRAGQAIAARSGVARATYRSCLTWNLLADAEDTGELLAIVGEVTDLSFVASAVELTANAGNRRLFRIVGGAVVLALGTTRHEQNGQQ
jgi:hypothetical protein